MPKGAAPDSSSSEKKIRVIEVEFPIEEQQAMAFRAHFLLA